jgi:hypothetical protein
MLTRRVIPGGPGYSIRRAQSYGCCITRSGPMRRTSTGFVDLLSFTTRDILARLERSRSRPFSHISRFMKRSRRARKTRCSGHSCEFHLITDHPVDNSAGSWSRLPLQFGGDRQPVGCIEFASFALQALPGTGPWSLRPVARRGRRLARRLPPGAQFVAPSYSLKIFFCRRQGQDLRQIRALPNLTT